MKQVPLLQGLALLIEMPEGASNISIEVDVWPSPTSPNDDHSLHWHTVNNERDYLMLPQGNWRIIGMLSEVRESEASKFVKYTGLGGYVDSYENYQNKGYLFLPTAIKSLESAILAEGYYLDENPIDYPNQLDPKFYDEPYDGAGFYQEIYSSAIEDWQAAQSRVLDRSRCLLLGREDV